MSFPANRLSLVERTRSGDAETRRVAFATIIDAYWKPVFKYLRVRWSLSPDEAADLTQEFFTTALESDVVRTYDPARARLRTHLRVCLDGFASNANKPEHSLKRGGGITMVPLDFASAESEIMRHETALNVDDDELFYREWVRALFDRSLVDLKRHADVAGRSLMFDVFARYDLIDDVAARPTYTDIARALNLTPATVTNYLAAMRRQHRSILLERLRELTSSDEEWETEAARLLDRT
jgi:DNA-directed RNA polymerase specialized sigma24 family protein